MRTLVTSLAVLALVSCSGGSTTAPASQEAASKRIPITSKSPQAVEQFEKGRALLENLRMAEASEALKASLTLDPDFALARAYYGQAIPGPDGLAELERAAGMSASLPPAERLTIEALLANRRGDTSKSTDLWKQVVQAAPDDWRAHFGMGQRLLNEQKHSEAATAFRKATELNPNAGPAYNLLGYAELREDNIDGAVAAFQQYAKVLPSEPNPQDSLAEALLAAGRFNEADTAFRKAAELSPQFWNAWEGVAYTKFFAGDWEAGREALNRAREAASRPIDKVNVETLGAWAALAERNTTSAVKGLQAAETVADAQPSAVALVPVNRATVLIDAGRYRDAIAEAGTALQRADSGQYPPGQTINIRRQALTMRAIAEARLGDAGAVQKTIAVLQQAATGRPDDPQLQSSVHLAQGMLATAQGDARGARDHFAQCDDSASYCRWQLVLAAEKAGDKAAADAARTRLLSQYVRDPMYLYVRSRLQGSGKTP